MRPGRMAVTGVLLLVAGLLLGALGGGVLSAGTGALGLETATFTRIHCWTTRVQKGGTVLKCTGESPGQVRENDEADRRAAEAVLRAHRDGVRPVGPRQRTPLLFVERAGRDDPERITASRAPLLDRWVAHSGRVVGTGLLLTGLAIGALGWGGHRLWSARRH